MQDHNSAFSGAAPLPGKGVTPLTQLRQIIQTGRIPNALLFYGAPGTGKKEAALEFVKSCNCSDPGDSPCDLCTSCKKINTGMHPDMIFLGPEKNKKIITIAQIREMGQIICARANEADFRMVCIQDAHLMNTQAQNGLLKVLEEPPEHTFFILLATGTAPLLPTILSRCRQFRFTPVQASQIREILETEHGIDPRTAAIICRTAGEDPSLALTYAGKGEERMPDWGRFRQWLILEITAVFRGENLDRVANGLDLSRKLSGKPDLLGDAMAVIRTVLRDLCVFRYNPDQIVNLDFFDVFKDISQIHAYPTFLEWLNAFFETEKRLESNSGQRLTLDRFFLKLSLS